MAFRLRPNNMHYVVFVLLFCVNLSDGFSGGDIDQDTVIPFKNEDYVINETIRIQDNATLTLESGVTLRFRENHGMIVHGALIANGTDKSPITFRSLSDETEKVGYTRQFSRKTVRLVDGGAPNQGRLEVLYNGIWGTVCDDEWSDVNTEVACRGLGFTSGVFTSVFGPGRGPIWMDDVQCRQTDLGLEECSHPGFGVHNCGRFIFNSTSLN